MAFVVDGAEWNFNGWTKQQVVGAIETLVARVWIARDRDEVVWIGDDLQTRPVLGARDLWSLLSPDAPITLPSELGHELAAWLGSAPRYLDAEPWPDGILETLIQVGLLPAQQNSDQAWAHHNVRLGRSVACLSLKQSGPYNTVSQLGNAVVHWVADEATNRAFWRAAIDDEGGSAETLERLAPHAFPSLYFHTDVWQGLRSFAGGYHAARAELQRYLTSLDDHGAWAFTFPPPALAPGEAAGLDGNALPPNQLVERRFRGLNLDMAPESPDVRADGNCRRAREIGVGDRILYCEWHAKLEPHRNRIHVHPPVPESNGKVVIAKFHQHLPLPA